MNVEKTKKYRNAFFKAPVIKVALEQTSKFAKPDPKTLVDVQMNIQNKGAQWSFDDLEEFFSEYKSAARFAHYRNTVGKYKCEVFYYRPNSEISVKAPSRTEIETVFNIFEDALPDSKLPEPEEPVQKPVIFIGHGGSPLWRDLKDHLQDKHGYEIVAYEIGSRSGHAIRDILEEMMEKSTIAFLVLTGEDQTGDKKMLARQNVVHETGLFQGKLGFSRAIVLLEEGTEEFSNLAGIQQIPFKKGNIKETFGEVLAVLRREFQ